MRQYKYTISFADKRKKAQVIKASSKDEAVKICKKIHKSGFVIKKVR